MRRSNVALLLALGALALLPLLVGAAPAKPVGRAGAPIAPGRVLVKLRPGVPSLQAARLHAAHGAEILETIPGIGVQVLRVANGGEPGVVAAYARSHLVTYVEPDAVGYALENPVSDPFFEKQWGLHNIGQTYKGKLDGTLDADIDAPEAWSITTGSPQVLIAILDTGIDQDHPDLEGKLADNVNFSSSGTVDDLYGHGTHVAGIAAAETDNAEGVAGVGYDSALLNVKVLNDMAMGNASWVAKGIVWAADHGAQVINMSLAFDRPSRTLESAVDYAWAHGVVVVAAAGNDGNTKPNYPARYENCIAVAATDAHDEKASWSQYGDWVDVAAPGVDVFSTFPNHPFTLQAIYGRANNYDYGNGTSMAAPHVVGLAALLWDQGHQSNAEVRERIEYTADSIAGTGVYWRWGRINAHRAVNAILPPSPGGGLHVGTVEVTVIGVLEKGKNTFVVAEATVQVVDAYDQPVPDATVYGDWALDGSVVVASASGTTSADGLAAVSSGRIKAVPGSNLRFCVTDAVDGSSAHAPPATAPCDAVVVE